MNLDNTEVSTLIDKRERTYSITLFLKTLSKTEHMVSGVYFLIRNR